MTSPREKEPTTAQAAEALPREVAFTGLGLIAAVALQGALLVACQLTASLWLVVPCALLGLVNLGAGLLLLRGLGPTTINVIPLAMGLLGVGAALL